MADKFCLDLTMDDLKTWCDMQHVPSFRAKQIYKWLSSGVIDTSEMTNIPKDLRAKLEEDFIFGGMTVINEFVSQIDGTVKLVYRLYDGNVIETVIMRYKTGLSICISSQAGCRMGCTFCASAKLGFGRSLTSGEMLAQVLLSQKHVGERIHSVVVMGIGEPFDNYDNTIGFIRLATDSEGLNLGARHITISTCGLVDKIDEFTALDLQVNLAISLHAPDDTLRRELMPIANKYALPDLIAACRRYTEATHRRITFEYSLFAGKNDSVPKPMPRPLPGSSRECSAMLISLPPTNSPDLITEEAPRIMSEGSSRHLKLPASTLRLGARWVQTSWRPAVS